jgi:P-type Ca2+ transporter type 2C
MEPSTRALPHPWHTLTSSEVCTLLATSPEGLSSDEAARRLAACGPNLLSASRRISPWTVLFEQFKNVLIVILLAATVLSVLLGHGVEAAAIAVIVTFAVLLGFFQEFRAGRAIEALRLMAAPAAVVFRNGLEVTIPARDLVPGDLVLVRAGDKIPADLRLAQALNLRIEEASLTGESAATEKNAHPVGNVDLALGDRVNMAYAGTSVSFGRGSGIVVATGMQTEFGKIAGMLQSIETGKTPLQESLDRVGSLLTRAAIVGVAVIVVLGLLRGEALLEMLIFGIALAVAVVPEALPAVVTISLAIGVQRMVRRHALVRRLPAVETLGCTSVICSDKTGTLTRDEMTVRCCSAAGELFELSGTGYQPLGAFFLHGVQIAPSAPLLRLLQAAALASDALLEYHAPDERWSVRGDPTEGALVVAAAKAGLEKASLDEQYPRLDEIPFSSETKRMTTLHAAGEGVVAYAKGAPEVILDSCWRQSCSGGEEPLDPAAREHILEVARGMADGALRVLAVASRSVATVQNAQEQLTFLGLLGMSDPPRPEARAAIQTCREAGIKPVMITGDHPATALAVARELGLLSEGRVVTGAQLETMDEAQLEREVESIAVYARVSPADKLRVVAALQKKGHIVAMTGDGVNDAPALKKADVGIAMGLTGTQVSREAAAMTLTDDNFASIVAAVEEGRAIFDNIKKYLMYLLSSNIGEIGLMAGALFLGLPLPLSAVQILYVNLATDGLPALALAVDPPDPALMRRPPRDLHRGIFTRPVVFLMLAGGAWSTLVNLCLFSRALASGRSRTEAMTMTFVSLALIEFFKAYNFRSDRQTVLKHPFANRWLNLAIVWELALLILIVYLPALQAPLGTFALTGWDWVLILLAAASIFPVLELAKWLVRRVKFGSTSE